MRKRNSLAPLLFTILLVLPVLALSQAAQETRTLIVNGQSGQVAVVQVNGRSYVDLEALARIGNGSLGFNGNQITLTLPGAASSPAAPSQRASSSPRLPGLSRGLSESGHRSHVLGQGMAQRACERYSKWIPLSPKTGSLDIASRPLRVSD